MSEFTNNHYVAQWYQRRFMVPGTGKYHYLDLSPETVVRDGHRYTRDALRHLGPASCFAQDDLYTVRWGDLTNVDIEKFFFGKIDSAGKAAVEYFAGYDHKSASQEALHGLLEYMSVQKLRTPKGLGWLSLKARTGSRNLNLIFLQQIRRIFCATWTDCVWQIADASVSPTKLIISDHPVTVYNRACFPLSNWCKGFNDPDILMVATHTYFPLSMDKVLILTNLSWARDPYQNETKMHPNPRLFRPAMFNYMAIQTGRQLTEQEVLAINYITKTRAHRYVAAAEKEWLYPERQLETDHWRKLGNGLMLMPEPRDLYMGGEILIGYKDGHSEAFGPYGHRPWQEGYEDKQRDARESVMLERFKAEFARMQGPKWRGASQRLGGRSLDGDLELHERYLEELRARGKRSKKRR
jgi:hypothetical protein